LKNVCEKSAEKKLTSCWIRVHDFW